MCFVIYLEMAVMTYFSNDGDVTSLCNDISSLFQKAGQKTVQMIFWLDLIISPWKLQIFPQPKYGWKAKNLCFQHLCYTLC
jgi:hypothetical protein